MPPALATWSKRTLGPALTLKELNLICWGCFVVFLVLPLGIVAAARRGIPDTDFVNFYAMGRILNEYPAEKLYDLELQTRIRNEVHPLMAGAYGAVPYPPYAAIVFRPLARMPYRAAYGLWLSITLALYLAGLCALGALFLRKEPLRQALMVCLALSFYPFVMETLVNGQVAAVGFLAIALALREEASGRHFLSGLALSACLYKPTLLVLLVPMVVVTGRLRTLVGFAAGATASTVSTVAIEGARVWSGYLAMLRGFGEASLGVHTRSFLPLEKYVDLSTFSALIPAGRSWLGIVLTAACACAAGLSLLWMWWRSVGAERDLRTLVWATTLTWTLLLNVYVPLYDVILIVISVVVTAGAWKVHTEARLHHWFTFLWFLIFVCSWVTVRVAEATGLQIMTVLLAALGTLQLTAFRRLDRRQSSQAKAVQM